MAGNTIEIVINADNNASGTLKSLHGDLGGIATLAGGALTVGLAAATAAFGAMAGATALAVREAMAAEGVQFRLAAVLNSTKNAAGLTVTELNSMAGALQNMTAFDDESIGSAQALLLTFTNIGKDIFPDVTEAVLDTSAALGQDLKSSAIQIGKALQDPITGMTALRRVGVAFTDQQEEMVKKLIESGQGMQAQKLILAELKTEFGGMAQAMGETTSGGIAKVQNRIGDILETIGGPFLEGIQEVSKAILETLSSPEFDTLVSNLVADIREGLIPAFSEFATWLREDGIGAMTEFGAKLTDLMGLVQMSVGGWKSFFDLLGGIGDKLKGDLGKELSPFTQSITGAMGAPEGGMTPQREAAARALIAKTQREQAAATAKQLTAWGAMQEEGFYKPLVARKPVFSMPPGATGAAAQPGLSDYMALAFPNVGAAQGWQAAFAGQHGGRAPGQTDVRDYAASQLFAAKYGRGPSEEEWKARYYKGSFEGIDENSLDQLFGKAGTWKALLQGEQELKQKQTQALLDAFAKLGKDITQTTLTVRFPGATEYASGGIVSGAIGAPTMALVHGGETITPPGRGGVQYNLTIHSNATRESLEANYYMMHALARFA